MDWKELLRRLGLSPTQLQWRWMNFKASLSRSREQFSRRREQLAYQHKVCQGCGNVIDHAATSCPLCHAPAGTWQAEVARKAVPDAGPRNMVTLGLLAAILVNEAIGMLAFGTTIFQTPTPQSLLSQGAMMPALVRLGEWWRMITAGYLHIGWMHLLFNSIALFQSGMILEPELGESRLFVVYTLSLLGGTAADMLAPTFHLSAGASGAIFGLIGFGLSYSHWQGSALRPMRDFFLQWALFSCIFTYVLRSSIDVYCHAGGLVTGLLLGWVLYRDLPGRRIRDGAWAGLAVLCLLVTLVSFGYMGRYIMAKDAAQKDMQMLFDTGSTSYHTTHRGDSSFDQTCLDDFVSAVRIRTAVGSPPGPILPRHHAHTANSRSA